MRERQQLVNALSILQLFQTQSCKFLKFFIQLQLTDIIQELTSNVTRVN